MHNLIKKFFGLCLLVGLSLSATSVLAADAGVNPAYLASISKVTLSKTAYAQSDTVTGSFNLVNSGSQTASDLYYRISLAGQYDKNQIPKIIYAQADLQGPLSVAGSKTSVVNFSYKLPAYIGGSGLGIKIDLVTKQGQPLAWANGLFTVAGSMSAVTVDNFSIGLGGQFFTPTTGPTVHEGETPTVVVGLTNPQKTSMTLSAQIKIYNRVVTGDALYSSTSVAFVLTANAKKTLTYNLPLFDKTPGVYAGTINFVDANGASHSPVLEFRYIIGGDIATIQSVNTGKGVAIKGQKVNVSVTYSGAPFDTRTLQGINVGNADLSVTLYNEKDELVGQASSSVSVTDVATQFLGITALTDARALRADAVLTKGGKTLSKLSTSFSPALNTLSSTPVVPTSSAPSGLIIWLLVAAGVLVLLIVGVFIIKKNKQSPPTPPLPPNLPIAPIAPIPTILPNVPVTPPPPPTTPASLIPPVTLVALLLLGGLFFYSFNAGAQGGTCNDPNGDPVAIPTGFHADANGNCVGNIVTVNTIPTGWTHAISITGPAGVYTDDANQFNVRDPDGNAVITYGVSVNGDHKPTPDYFIPSKTTTVSGTATTSVFLSFASAGAKKFAIEGVSYNAAIRALNVLSEYQDFNLNVVQNPISAATFTGAGGWKLISFNGQRTGNGQLLLSPRDITLSVQTQSGTYHPGDSFNMQFQVNAIQCGNVNQRVTLTINPAISGFTSTVPPLLSTVPGFKTPPSQSVYNGSASCGVYQTCNTYTNSTFSSGWMQIPTSTPPGTYRVTFEVIDVPDNWVGTVFGYYDINVTNTLGALDTVTCDTISGWACVPGASAAASVDLYKDRQYASSTGVGDTSGYVTSTTANGTGRADIGASCNGTAHGFQIATPASFKDGLSHIVYAYGIPASATIANSTELAGSSQSLTCNSCAEATAPAVPVLSHTTADDLNCYAAPNFSETHLTFTPVTEATSYSVYRSDPSTDPTGVNYVDITDRVTFSGPSGSPTGFFDSSNDLTAGHIYNYKILASNCQGSSDYSNIIPATASSACPITGGIQSCSDHLFSLGVTGMTLSNALTYLKDDGQGWCMCKDSAKILNNSSVPPTCDEPATASCIATVGNDTTHSATSAKVGDLVTWRVVGTTAAGGYTWKGADVPEQNGGPTLPVHYSTIGKKTMQVAFGTKVFICTTPVGGFPITSSQVFQPI